MSPDTLNGSSAPSLTSLVGGILADAQQLMAQQARLLRVELREDLLKARTGAVFLGFGLGVTAVGGLLLCFMLPMLLYELAGLPLWASFGICGVVLLFVGGGASFVAYKNFQSAASLKESTTALKENVACLLRRN